MRVEEGSTADALALAPALAQAATAAAPTPSWVMLRATPRVQKAGLFVKDLQLDLLPPPAVSSLTVSAKILGGGDTSTVPNLPGRHPSASDGSTLLDPCKPEYPYVVAVDASGGGALLLCIGKISDWDAFADAAPADCSRPGYFLYDTLSDTSTVLVAPHQPGSMGLARRDGAARGQLVVAGLTPTAGEEKACLSYCMPKFNNHWVHGTMVCKWPNKNTAWGNNGVVAVGSKLFWVDLAQGLLSCDIFAEEKVLSFVSFEPVSFCDSTSSTHRRVQAIAGKLILLQTEWLGGEARLAVWRLMDAPDCGWIHEYSVGLTEIWAKAPIGSSLVPEVQMVMLADPHNPRTIYILQATSVFTVDTLGNTVTECAEGCDIILYDIFAWELPPSLLRKLYGSTGCWDSIVGLLSLVCKPMEVVSDEEDASRRMMLFFRF